MTRDEILAMAPGRELDELIHKHVIQADYPFELAHRRGETRWSQEIAMAWEVQEKLQENGGMVLGCYGSKNGARWFTVQTMVGAKEISVTSHTAPEAICKAALLAVMEA